MERGGEAEGGGGGTRKQEEARVDASSGELEYNARLKGG
jgi:hypothetical protein